MGKGDYKISDMYQGGYSSLKPKYGDVFTGYRINPGSFGMTTDPRTANVLQDVSSKLSSGVKHIEVAGVSPQVFEAMPDQQLKELNRLSKLTGVDITLHGPIAEPSGLTDRGFSETQREAAERQMLSAVERGHIINPDGNIPITFHSSAIGLPGTIPGKTPEETMIINTQTGSIHKLPLKERYFPGEEGKKNIQNEIKKLNEEQWVEHLDQLKAHADMGKEAIEDSMATKLISDAEKKAGKDWSKDEEHMRKLYTRGSLYMNSSYNSLQQLFDLAYGNQNIADADRKKIDTFFKEITEKANQVKTDNKSAESVQLRKEIIDKGIDLLKDLPAPQTYADLNGFAKEKAIETFSNIALKSYKKFGDKSPIVSVENPPAGQFPFSSGEELRDIVEGARKKFVENAVKDGMSEDKAKGAAEKLLGVTWDVGHINMLRKFGLENKDIIAQTEKVAPLVKHVHLSDNFGFEHTELPMGMGNVPIKEIMEKLGKPGFDARKIVEAAQWWEHFKGAPFKETLEAFGSPIYGMEMAPYWNQNPAFQQNYFGGYGMMLPQINYESFGAGFSKLPMELGGQRQGAEGSRMSGRGME